MEMQFGPANEAEMVVDLNGEWLLFNPEKSVQVSAIVPGQAHLDLIRAKILNEDPYYGTNYVKNSVRKIIETRWIFEKKFFLKKIISYAFALLDCEGLDTIATVILNGKTIGASDNQFRRFIFDATSALQAGTNTIQIQFENAVKQAKDMADNYPYYVPDMFNMSAAQHGFPHRNFVRKEQCSFSWDWGPAFAPCGIWRPISLKLDKDGVLVKRWYVNTHFDHIQGLWEVKVSIEIISINERKLRIGVQFDDIKVSSSETTVSVKAREFVAQHSTRLEQSMVKRWWPRGYGDPKLYKMKASLIDEDGTSIATYNSRCGFRTCELVQEPIVKGRAGDAFKFRINGCDIFAKGANWIPGHVFDQLMTTDKKRSLLEGCVAANMNMIRIWGGGRYETDQFYELCDELGIMVWQEFMFACALYPTGQSFLDNVKHETSDQVKRLMIHPSIILWSGNNENQEFLVKGWDEVTLRNPYIFTVDYHKLYIETIMSTLCSLDTSRPYTTTSPSAGLISCSPYTERYVLSDLERGLYGDVHFYDYKHNGLHIEYYPNARFVSEYGAQSMPSFKTWKRISSAQDWHPLSKLSVHRNHHRNGQHEMLQQIEFQFRLPSALSTYYHLDPESEKWSKPSEGVQENLFDLFCYLTQLVQARSIACQTEHYIRGRQGDSHTMGALYWQLNDIWPAPTWSSIEHCGRWKPLHNFMKHSFADILVSGYQLAGEHSLHIHVSNGRPVTVKGTLYIRSYNIQSGELKEQPKTCFSIKCYKEYAMKVEPSLLRVDNDDATCVIFATAIITSEGSMSEQTFEMLPLPFPCRDAFPLESLVGDPKIVVEAMKVETNEEGYYVHITLRSSELAGFVWLEWESQGEEIEGYFEENAFWILPGGSGHTLFHGKDKKNLKYIQEHNLHIKSLWDVLQCSRLLEDDILSETII